MAFDKEELNKRRQERDRLRQKKAARLRILRLVLGLAAAAAVLVTAVCRLSSGEEADVEPSQPQPATTEAASAETVPAETVPDQVIHFVAGGDINITDKVVAAGASVDGYDYSDIFLDIAGVLSGGDITAVNFEGNLYGDSYGTDSASAPKEFVAALGAVGVDLIQTANSFANYNGLLGLQATLDTIRSVGLEPVGTFANTAEFEKTGGFTIREVDGIRVAVVAFTKGMNGMGLPNGSESCVNLLYTDYSSTYQKVDTEGITEILQAIAREKPDVTIALLHWGSEYNDQISKTQASIEALMLAGGVDAIIGTHAHYVQQIRFAPEQGTVVAYSLGDLLGDGEKAGTNYSVLLELEITKSGQTGQVSITGCDYVPVFLAEEEGQLRLLRIREAITAYENRFLGRVSQQTYEAMKLALQRIEARVDPAE